MDDIPVIDQIRAGASRVDPDRTDVEALVRGAVGQGRRRRARRRVAAAVSGLVAAGIAATAVVTAPVPLLGPGREVGPAAPPTTTAAAPRTPTPSTPSSPKPSPGGTPGRVTGTPKQVRDTLLDLLPTSARVSDSEADREEGVNGFAWEHNAAIWLTDDKGTAPVFGGIGEGAYTQGAQETLCADETFCYETRVPGRGVVWITRSPAGDKPGEDRWVFLNRPDGSHVWFHQRTWCPAKESQCGDGKGRTGLLLTDAEGIALVTDPAWDALFTP